MRTRSVRQRSATYVWMTALAAGSLGGVFVHSARTRAGVVVCRPPKVVKQCTGGEFPSCSAVET